MKLNDMAWVLDTFADCFVVTKIIGETENGFVWSDRYLEAVAEDFEREISFIKTDDYQFNMVIYLN